MSTATVLAVFWVPMFFVSGSTLFKGARKPTPAAPANQETVQ